MVWVSEMTFESPTYYTTEKLRRMFFYCFAWKNLRTLSSASKKHNDFPSKRAKCTISSFAGAAAADTTGSDPLL